MVDKMFVCFPHSYRGRGSWLVEEEEQEKEEKEAGVVDNFCVDPFCSWSGLGWSQSPLARIINLRWIL